MKQVIHKIENIRYQDGLSYVEVILATVLLMLALIPALETLQSGIQGSLLHESQTLEHYHLTTKLEEVLAQPFNSLDAVATVVADPKVITSYSDPVTSNRRRLVYLSRYDADNADADNDAFTGIDDGLIWVRIEIENSNHAIETLTSR